jgi:hypothetical protein
MACYADWWSPQYVLLAVLLFVTVWLVWGELDWPQPWNVRAFAVAANLGVTLLGYNLWRLSIPGGDLPLWAALVGQMMLLELREARGGAQLTTIWRVVVMVALPLFIGVWLLVEQSPFWALFFAIIMIVLGLLEPYFRVWRTLEIVHRLVANARDGPYGPSHLIGHSLGTFLSGRHFETYPSTTWNRLVLVGGVISEVYDWSLMLNPANSLSRIQDVRNEHGGLDLVVRLIRYAGRWATSQRLGTAGWRGLRSQGSQMVHDVADPYNICPRCPPTTRLHNFHFRGYMHSTYFFTRTHMRDFWLPYFLGHIPSEFAYFLKLCITGAQLLRQGRMVDFDEVADELRSTDWHWNSGNGRRLDAEITRNLGALLPNLDSQYTGRSPLPSVETLNTAPRMLCQLIDRAIDAQQRGNGPDSLLELLNPPSAIAYVAQASLQNTRTNLGLPPKPEEVDAA